MGAMPIVSCVVIALDFIDGNVFTITSPKIPKMPSMHAIISILL